MNNIQAEIADSDVYDLGPQVVQELQNILLLDKYWTHKVDGCRSLTTSSRKVCSPFCLECSLEVCFTLVSWENQFVVTSAEFFHDPLGIWSCENLTFTVEGDGDEVHGEGNDEHGGADDEDGEW